MERHADEYPNLYTLFGGYLNQDSDLWGETVREVVGCYKQDLTEEMLRSALLEIEKFEVDHRDDLDGVFYRYYGHNFDPKLWGYTTASFFEELKRLLVE